MSAVAEDFAGSVFAGAAATLDKTQPMRIIGRVAALRGLSVLVDELRLPVGSLVSIAGPGTWTARPGRHATGRAIPGEVVGFNRDQAIVMLLGQTVGIRPGDEVAGEQVAQVAGASRGLLGRCIDGLGRPIDSRGPLGDTLPVPLNPDPISPMRRRRIARAMHTGLRAVDLMCTLGRGQRIGFFAGPGVGKSTLLGTVARRSDADVNVIALIGERGREVRDFVEHSLGPEGLARSVVVVATGDESPLLRVRAAKLACSIAEFFRDDGADVVLMMDSVTRFAHAQRQIGLSVGEPPASKGYTPSVFASMALLLERAGAVDASGGKAGSITGIYTILVEGDDLTEPVADAARGILDGHVILSRKLAQKAHYPAIDVLDSVSRVADDVSDPEHAAARRRVMRLLAIYRDVEDLVQIGAYAKGTNPEADIAIQLNPRINELLRQGRDEFVPFERAREQMIQIARESQPKSAPGPARAGANRGARGSA